MCDARKSSRVFPIGDNFEEMGRFEIELVDYDIKSTLAALVEAYSRLDKDRESKECNLAAFLARDGAETLTSELWEQIRETYDWWQYSHFEFSWCDELRESGEKIENFRKMVKTLDKQFGMAYSRKKVLPMGVRSNYGDEKADSAMQYELRRKDSGTKIVALVYDYPNIVMKDFAGRVMFFPSNDEPDMILFRSDFNGVEFSAIHPVEYYQYALRRHQKNARKRYGIYEKFKEYQTSLWASDCGEIEIRLEVAKERLLDFEQDRDAEGKAYQDAKLDYAKARLNAEVIAMEIEDYSAYLEENTFGMFEFADLPDFICGNEIFREMYQQNKEPAIALKCSRLDKEVAEADIIRRPNEEIFLRAMFKFLGDQSGLELRIDRQKHLVRCELFDWPEELGADFENKLAGFIESSEFYANKYRGEETLTERAIDALDTLRRRQDV